MPDDPRSTSGREPDRVHERASDPADAADRPLEPRSSQEPLNERDEPRPDDGRSPHHKLNTPVGDVDPAADSDPYMAETPEDDADTASGTTGSGQGADERYGA